MEEPQVSRVIERSVTTTLSSSAQPADVEVRSKTTPRLFDRAIRCDWTPDGARVLFNGTTEMAREVMEFVLAERISCAELTYHVATMPPHDHIALFLRGPGDLREAIRAWVGAER